MSRNIKKEFHDDTLRALRSSTAAVGGAGGVAIKKEHIDDVARPIKKEYNDDALRSLRSPAAVGGGGGASGAASSSRMVPPQPGGSPADPINNMPTSSFRPRAAAGKPTMAGLPKGANVLASPSARNIPSANVSFNCFLSAFTAIVGIYAKLNYRLFSLLLLLALMHCTHCSPPKWPILSFSFFSPRSAFRFFTSF
ncbi:hypothetical protein BDB00DRAFT_412500 [Zychaea mexicana]|uniref:uncharacterized protein n=1 Tax=Zychaea mexicana TaxID=64656 RepID=UPI0022FE748C|nr:uncharacterized protein BDB00DRAFT_412500 [Zychaea mexicana]KAI9492890.1 hypothetical protein BDB00DRAFT_412500 [Zychaea mexicana]